MIQQSCADICVPVGGAGGDFVEVEGDDLAAAGDEFFYEVEDLVIVKSAGDGGAGVGTELRV